MENNHIILPLLASWKSTKNDIVHCLCLCVVAIIIRKKLKCKMWKCYKMFPFMEGEGKWVIRRFKTLFAFRGVVVHGLKSSRWKCNKHACSFVHVSIPIRTSSWNSWLFHNFIRFHSSSEKLLTTHIIIWSFYIFHKMLRWTCFRFSKFNLWSFL